MFPMGPRPRYGRRLSASLPISTPVYSFQPFSPLSLQPYIWYDAADTRTITSSSGVVSAWADKSGLARNLSASGVNRPFTEVQTINNLNVLTFNGSQHVMTTSNFTSPLRLHIFAVARAVNFSRSINTVMEHYSGGGMALQVRSDAKVAVFLDSATNYNGTGTNTISTNTTYLFEFSWNGFQMFSWVNTSLDRLNTVTGTMTTPTAPFRIGDSTFTNRQWAGNFAEIVGFTGPLSTYGQQAVRNYLNAKWAIY